MRAVKLRTEFEAVLAGRNPAAVVHLLRLGRGGLPQHPGDGSRRLAGQQALRRLVERVDRGPEEAA